MMNWIFTAMILLSILASVLTGSGQALGAAVPEGAKAGAQLALTLAGPMLFWCGLGKLMDETGATQSLAHLLRRPVSRLFPSTRGDPILSGHLSANLCANLLGLGNAATPRGIEAARRMKKGPAATDEMCRLIVLNTASIQLIPSTVAAIRSGLGCPKPFDILPAVWITSLCSAGMGLLSAYLLGKVWKHG